MLGLWRFVLAVFLSVLTAGFAHSTEYRPASVVQGGLTTAYTYAADGSRLLRTDPTGKITATFGPVEIRDFGGATEAVLTYPHPDLRLKNGTEVTWLHRDHLASVRSMTNAAGARAAWQVYVPFGELVQIGAPLSPEETKGFVGERFDSDVELQYLNARYYDPKLGLFLQPDWFEVTKAGVGTNRYAYSGNDPVNKLDPGGNVVEDDEPEDRFRKYGVEAHKVLADFVNSGSAPFDRQVPRYEAERPLLSGVFGIIESKYKGQPDASRRDGPNAAEVFDWKPVTHKNSEFLQQMDRIQRVGWDAAAVATGKVLSFADTSQILPTEGGIVAGTFLGEPNSNGRMAEYEVVAYGHDEKGVALYDIRETGAYQETLTAKAARDIRNAMRHMDTAPPWTPVPGRLKWRFP